MRVSLRLLFRRLLFLALVAGSVAAVALLLADMLRANGLTPLEQVIFVISTILLVPISTSFWLAVMGFVVELRGRDPLALDVSAADAETGELRAPTAIVVPVCNEDPERVIAGLAASLESLEQTGHGASFETFVLSDTTDPRRWLDEELALVRFAATLPRPGSLHYRNRPRNLEHKAGNIADFCRRWGDRFRYMIIFDADSVMSGRALVRLVRLMEQDPRAGIIQAPPLPVNRQTLFGRLQQFAAAVYSPTWTAGLVWLQGGEGNYYGHNAILRVAPFVEHCRLPTLPGRAPLGGSILSHDFVEAALMCRAGYRVHLAAQLGGSFEEPPPTLIDYAARDRRWCQGNLQHARLLGLPGLRFMSRCHLFMGVVAYASAPLWILLLVVSTLEAVRWELAGHEYFAPGGTLFPTWEISVGGQAQLLFTLVMLLLFLPRLLALLSRLAVPECRRRFGGGWRLLASCACEAVISMLLAPVLALLQTRFVLDTLRGRSTGWGSQPREDHRSTLADAIRRHGGTTVMGIAWAVLLARIVPELFWWMFPVLAGMTLAVPLSMLSSRVSLGLWARRHGLFLTPEEVDPQTILRLLHEKLDANDARSARERSASALEQVLADPAAYAAHLRFTSQAEPLDELERHRLSGLVLKCRLQGPAELSDEEQRSLLLVPRVLARLLPEHRRT